jgi:hypothetical protein
VAGIAVLNLDDYVVDVLMRDLVGHDRKPASYLVYLWLAAEQARRQGAVQVSYQELAEAVGLSKSSAQAGVGWLMRRKLLAASKESATAVPAYTVRTPWRDATRRVSVRGSG